MKPLQPSYSLAGARWRTEKIELASEAGAIDFEHGVVLHKGSEYRFPPLPPELLAILEDSGLISHVKKVLAGNG